MDSDLPNQITSDTGLFVLIPEWVIDLPMSAGAFRLYAVLGRYADWADGTAWPSRKTLAGRLNASVDSTDRWLKELVDMGVLEICRRVDPTPNATNRNLTNLYKVIRVAPSRKDAPTPSRKDAATPSRKDAALTITIFDHNQIRTTDAIDRVFEAWLKSTGKDPSRTKLDAKRRARISWALGNYSEEDVVDAVIGWENSPFHSGKNSQRKVYNDITLLLRDAAHLEQMRDLARSPKQTAGLPAWQTLQTILERND
jgi:hypothetical protein